MRPVTGGVRMPPVKFSVIALNGGLDQLAPTLSTKPGVVRDASNFECAVTGGYTRISGYERFSGQPAPSAGLYTALTITANTFPALLVTITGASSGATGVLCAQTATVYALTKVVGNFTPGENLTSGGTVAVLTDYAVVSDGKTAAQYLAAAADVYRADIAAVPGSGPVRGGFIYQDVVYAFRDDAGATYSALYKSSVSGWTLVSFFKTVSFTAGTTVPTEGGTLTEGGVTATIKRVVLQSGAWSGTAAGQLIITGVAGGNFSAGAATATGGSTLTLSGAEATITRLPGGRVDVDIANFAGSAITKRVYGADGVNKAFEFDGTTYVPIATGATTDTPKYALAHRQHLVLSVGSSLLISGPGLPYAFGATDGGAEIAVGDVITGTATQPGSQTVATMAVYTASATLMLYGTGSTNWSLVPFNTGTGALDYTAQNMSQSYVLDSRGVVDMQTTLNYGNFQQATLTDHIRSFINSERTRLTCSTLNRDKSQYRLYFNDGFGLYLTIINGKFLGAMPVYFPITGGVYQAFEGQFADGSQKVLAFGADGYVYQLDIGTSFDGANIASRLTLNYNSMGSPRVLKRYRKAAIEVQGSSYAEFDFSYLLGYSSTNIAQPPPVTYSTALRSSFWDAVNWDSFVWDGVTLAPSECEMVGTAENVALVFSSSNNYSSEFTLNSAIIHYTERRALR